MPIQSPLAALFAPLAHVTDVLRTWGWLFILFFVLWIAWETYQDIKHVDYVSSIHFPFLQITIPEENAQTPKAMEQAFEAWGGIQKNPDIIERYFEGYFLAWYTLELQCMRNRVRFIMVVPTNHRKFFEGVIYGQYPSANINEVEDYAQEYSFRDLEKTYDLYGTELVLVKDDIYPIRTYTDYEDVLAEDDKFIDPLQSVIEAFTTIEEGEQFWFQLLVKPVSGEEIGAWEERGEKEMLKISGRDVKEAKGLMATFYDLVLTLPSELLSILLSGPAEEKKKEVKQRLFLHPGEAAQLEGIVGKVSRSGFRTRMRVLHIAPAGKLHKPNISKAIGVFKQFNTFNLNQLKPDPDTKTNGPNYFLKQSRRRFRKRNILLNYQYRDFWGDKSGYMMNAVELATLFHFPNKYARSPSISRATSGLGSAPDNLPYT